MKTVKFCSKYALFSVLITALLAMQWATAHIHLPKHHNHDGIHHQHQIEAHAHQLMEQTVTNVDSSHHASHENIIEYDYETNLSKREKQKDSSFVAVITPVFKSPQLSGQLITLRISFNQNTKPRYLYHSPLNPRAPPLSS